MTDDATYRNMKQERDLALSECERLRADAERKRNMLISIKTFVKHTYPDAETKGVWVEPLRLIDAAIDAARKAKP